MTAKRRDRRERLSRKLAFYLRHRPEALGMRLDEDGFSDLTVEEIAARLGVSTAEIEGLVASDPKGRFTIRNGRIRANFGHSVPQGATLWLRQPPAGPDELPPVLYHGTSPERVTGILREGLKPRGRQFVHLSTTREGAFEVGKRYASSPTILEVDVRGALQKGVRFWLASASTVVATAVPPECVKIVRGERFGRNTDGSLRQTSSGL